MNIFKPLAAFIVAASAFAGTAHADKFTAEHWQSTVKPESHAGTGCTSKTAKACKPILPRDGGPKEPNRAGA